MRKAAIRLQSNGSNAIVSNHIGTDLTGTIDRGNAIGILIDGVPDNRIEGNLISDNNTLGIGLGIQISGIAARNNQVIGNRIATDVTVTVAIGNNAGIIIRNALENLIQDNPISGNANFISPPLTATGAIVTTATNVTTNDTSEFSQPFTNFFSGSNLTRQTELAVHTLPAVGIFIETRRSIR